MFKKFVVSASNLSRNFASKATTTAANSKLNIRRAKRVQLKVGEKQKMDIDFTQRNIKNPKRIGRVLKSPKGDRVRVKKLPKSVPSATKSTDKAVGSQSKSTLKRRISSKPTVKRSRFYHSRFAHTRNFLAEAGFQRKVLRKVARKLSARSPNSFKTVAKSGRIISKAKSLKSFKNSGKGIKLHPKSKTPFSMLPSVYQTLITSIARLNNSKENSKEIDTALNSFLELPSFAKISDKQACIILTYFVNRQNQDSAQMMIPVLDKMLESFDTLGLAYLLVGYAKLNMSSSMGFAAKEFAKRDLKDIREKMLREIAGYYDGLKVVVEKEINGRTSI